MSSERNLSDELGACMAEIDSLQIEIDRLNKALKYEENRSGRMGTHGPGCHLWGPSHYECLVREYEELRKSNDL